MWSNWVLQRYTLLLLSEGTEHICTIFIHVLHKQAIASMNLQTTMAEKGHPVITSHFHSSPSDFHSRSSDFHSEAFRRRGSANHACVLHGTWAC